MDTAAKRNHLILLGWEAYVEINARMVGGCGDRWNLSHPGYGTVWLNANAGCAGRDGRYLFCLAPPQQRTLADIPDAELEPLYAGAMEAMGYEP